LTVCSSSDVGHLRLTVRFHLVAISSSHQGVTRSALEDVYNGRGMRRYSSVFFLPSSSLPSSFLGWSLTFHFRLFPAVHWIDARTLVIHCDIPTPHLFTTFHHPQLSSISHAVLPLPRSRFLRLLQCRNCASLWPHFHARLVRHRRYVWHIRTSVMIYN